MRSFVEAEHGRGLDAGGPQFRVASGTRIERRETVVIGAGIFAACLTRILPALHSGVWFDEVHTIAMADLPVAEIVRATAADSHPPLYFLVVKALMSLGSPGLGIRPTFWLRLASILPGLALCGTGWGFARRVWGREAGLAALWLFALSPPLAYFSVELRNYSLLMFFLFIAVWAGWSSLENARSRANAWTILYATAMILACYTHNLAFLHLALHGILWVAAVPRSADPSATARRVGAAYVAIFLSLSPWIRSMVSQVASHAGAPTWIPDPEWWEIPAAIAYYLPYGPLEGKGPIIGGGWIESGATIVFLVLLRTMPLPDSGTKGAPRRAIELQFAAIFLVISPLVAAYLLHLADLAPIFLYSRYNMVVAPFWTTALVGALYGRPMIPFARIALVALLLLQSAAYCAYGQWRRTALRDDLHCLSGMEEAKASLSAPGMIAWTNPILDAWLSGASGDKFPRLCEPAPDAGTVFFLDHGADRMGGKYPKSEGRIVEAVLASSSLARSVKPPGCWMFEAVYAVEAENISTLLSRIGQSIERVRRETAREDLETILPVDLPVVSAEGWHSPATTEDGSLYVWSKGSIQYVDLGRLVAPGKYRAAVVGWLPEVEGLAPEPIRYRVRGSEEWSFGTRAAGTVVLPLEFEVGSERGGPMIELNVPPWRPIDLVPGSTDDRELGIMLLRIELEKWDRADPSRSSPE